MPIYADALTVPAGTQENQPATLSFDIYEPVIIEYSVFFPPGCHGQVYVAIFYGSEQIAPKPAGNALRGDNETIKWPETWRCPEKPCTITFRGWSPNASYDHEILCRVVTMPEKEHEAIERQRESVNLIVRFLKKIIGVG